MRRALGLAVLVALAVGAVLLATAGRPAGQAHAAAANGCVKHTKRIVKHVNRHGKRVRIVRFKHFWTCPEGATPPSSSAGGSGGGGGSTTTPTQPGPKAPGGGSTETPGSSEEEPVTNAVSVATVEEKGGGLGYTLSRATVKAGKVTIQLNNSKGGDPHTMRLEKLGSGGRGSEPAIVELETPPGKTATTSPQVELQPGKYRMWCTLYGHAERGMETELTVE